MTHLISRRECLAKAAAFTAMIDSVTSANGVSVAQSNSKLFPGERLVWGAGFPALAQFQRADSNGPLVILLPGGGHLARIFYGHPGARPEEFLVTHLLRAGFNVLALSYPTSHPAINHPVPQMTITQWAATAGAITAEYLSKEKLAARVIAAGWSLGSRLARDFVVALRRHAIDLEVFISLSGAPPMPGFGSLSRADLKLSTAGLRDDSSKQSSIFKSRDAQLAAMDELNGSVIIPRDAYAELYVADSPINFRGEEERYAGHGLITDVAAAVIDQGSFDFENYPLCADISGAGPLDMLHALTNASVWGMLSSQALYHRRIRPVLSERKLEPEKWIALRELMSSLTPRLSRHVEGSHFFFLGQGGASATAKHIRDLFNTATAIKLELSTLLGR